MWPTKKVKDKNGKTKKAFADVFRVLLDEKNYPLVFHCIGGARSMGDLARHIRERGLLRQTCFCGKLKFIDDAVAHKCRFLQLSRPWPRRFSYAAHAAGVNVILYRCDDPSQLPDFKVRGIDFVMTNCPGLMGVCP